jgi:RNA recognition motif-containing protein
VKDVSVKMDPMTNQSRGFGFVLFEDDSSIDAVVNHGDHSLDGKKVQKTENLKEN